MLLRRSRNRPPVPWRMKVRLSDIAPAHHPHIRAMQTGGPSPKNGVRDTENTRIVSCSQCFGFPKLTDCLPLSRRVANGGPGSNNVDIMHREVRTYLYISTTTNSPCHMSYPRRFWRRCLRHPNGRTWPHISMRARGGNLSASGTCWTVGS